MVTKSRKWGRDFAGRRMSRYGYGLMNDAQEGARLTLQHHLFKLAWKKNYLAPLRAPKLVLDVGCGTGIWGYEFQQEWPKAWLINLDKDDVLIKKYLAQLFREKKIRPEECAVLQPEECRGIQADGSPISPGQRYLFTKVDAREPLPFASGIFDFTHSRSPEFLSDEGWPQFIRELARVTHPDGWCEIVSFGRYYTGQPSKAAPALFDAGMRVGEYIGITLGGVNFSEHLRLAGVPPQAQHQVVVGKGKRQQELLIQDILHAEHQVKNNIVGLGIMTQEEVEQTIVQFEQDARAFGLFHPVYRACFQPRELLF